MPTWMSPHAERLAASASKAESSSQRGSSSRRKSGKGADVEAQLSAAKLKLEEHLSRLVEEEPASPEPEQVPHMSPSLCRACLLYMTSMCLSDCLHEDDSRRLLISLQHCSYPQMLTQHILVMSIRKPRRQIVEMRELNKVLR